ncbi:hypothetical protein H7F51_03090 [Novosphingobium flavum]|uniref:Uncharacterized protein n=1 Tax=Novosphingobium flavum TaxID=1778672 RepID=A0A7X1FPC7_9SPHN|nr:hypothetical protein [Novosphingobium flavum]MBC2664501.1 hypothetical protein [Novosphingobium flavum]
MRAFTALPLVALAALSGLAAPAQAQDAAGEKVNTVIVYGDDPCPASTGGEITVCARKAESERYRIPPVLREENSTHSEAWNSKVLAYETVGAAGTKSCSPVGPGGSVGCTQKMIDAAYAEKKQESEPGFAELISQERAKRAATVDADAAATQARVEQVEREQAARAQQEAAAKP